MSVAKICVREVDFAESQEPVWQAAERMHQRVVGCLIIANDKGEPEGIVTDRDLVERVVAQGKDPNSTLVADVMTHNPTTITEVASTELALALMRDRGFRRLPVVNPDGKVVGMLTLDDILMQLSQEFKLVGELLVRESPQGVAGESV